MGSIIAEELTLVELCTHLKVTPSWIHKAIKELDLPRSGRGKQRIFTKDDFVIFKTIKLLLICDFSWNDIKAIRQKEARLRRFLERRAEQAKSEGQPEGSWFGFYFLLQPSLPIGFSSVVDQKGEKKEFIGVMTNYILTDKQFAEYHTIIETIKQRCEIVATNLNNFMDGLKIGLYYNFHDVLEPDTKRPEEII